MPKRNIKASLVRYARIDGIGWRRGTIITAKNKRVKNNAMLYGGQEYTISEDSPYQVRYYEGGKARYVTVGPDYEAACALLEKHTASRQLESAHEALGIIKPDQSQGETAKPLAEAVADYIERKKSPSLKLSDTTIRHYEDTLPEFARTCGKATVHEIVEEDIVKYMDSLIKAGYSQKTRTMRYGTLRGFLRSSAVDMSKLMDISTHRRLSTKPPLETNPYTQEEIDRLLEKCDEYHQIVFQFLLATGLRYREANHLTWSNVDFERNIVVVPYEQKVSCKYRSRKTGMTVTTTVGFETKSRRGREVPIFPSMRVMLFDWRKRHPGRVFVFGSRRSDMPDNHWLEYGKRKWRKAGLNCGICSTCVERNECEGFYLHKFRHTYAHRCLDAGIGIHKVSRWLGHHSLEMTQIYLSGKGADVDTDPFSKE